MTVLVTGGTGYIGSHAIVELQNAGHQVLALDNLCNSSRESLLRVEQITGKPVPFVQGDIRDASLLSRVFRDYSITAVMHFAGLKAVGESVARPLEYYDVNVNGTLMLAKAMNEAGVFNLVFSSSATVYGSPESMPINEQCAVGGTTNPYGTSKLMVEKMLQDVAASDERWSIALLRYFNPVGAHESGLIGEDPSGVPNNLLPYVTQVAVGQRERLSVFGGDYPTEDGTGVRDYIHVVDLAAGHLRAIEYIAARKGVSIFNLGTGRGYSVLEIVAAFERVTGRKVPYAIMPRRAGDIAECWSDPARAKQELGWVARRSLEQMLADAWRWQSQNPNGFV
ncbi:UDP-glucose 4-epimerase GalE [Oceanimonas smirnovii]|uniref:UDP-glucose 4-epimerase GalE n=1 Tax=Oceanimonas smirnovii TaxID=264574 RepID=UPI00036E1F11|nr:UDP-glucose 4-epimerase GalE [Oceanimonas smirnovii]